MQDGVITKYDVAKVILFGACSDRIPKVGTRLESFPTSDLIWAERLLPIEAVKNRLPLWVLSGYGSGYGYGYGSGDGSGYGYGYGYGYGDGDGYGDGYGYGDGDGSGYGYGSKENWLG